MAQAGVPACSLVDSLNERQSKLPKVSLREHMRRSQDDDASVQPGLHLRPPLHSTASSADSPPLPESAAPAEAPETSVPRPSAPEPGSADSSGERRSVEPVVFDPEDLEAQRKWNEERIERRLRGEWERVSRRLADLVRSFLRSRAEA
jgi:hypothetical protein